jgi:hypothetical protein
MAALTSTTVYDIEDCKLFPVTANTSGASPTYGAAVDVPGISTLQIDPSLVSARVKGDGGKVINSKARIEVVTFSLTMAKLDLDVIATALTQNAVASTAGSETIDLDNQELPDFKLEGQVLDTDDADGDVHVILFICKVTGGTILGQSSDTFGQPTLSGEARSPEHTSTPIARFVINDTAVNIT